jgi:sterol desaturase/sphingolipid hydroxylase (fatty acid hydroxylase superfamily)
LKRASASCKRPKNDRKPESACSDPIIHFAGFGAIPGHIGFDKMELSENVAVDSHAYGHYLHHKYFEVNYGDGLFPFDDLARRIARSPCRPDRPAALAGRIERSARRRPRYQR